MIQVNDIHKAFGKVEAVRDVTFDANDGEITGLLGPNDAGKTTTLRKLLAPDRGSIRIDGLGVVPDGRGLYNRLTARENTRYFGEFHGMTRDSLEERIEELNQSLEMQALIDRRTEGFSQGQRVKVTIARALVHRLQTVLLDEPGNRLDVMATRVLCAYIKDLKAAGLDFLHQRDTPDPKFEAVSNAAGLTPPS